MSVTRIMFEIEIRQAHGNRTVLIEKPEVIFGRKDGDREVDVDLNPDTTVSRVHARVWQAEKGMQIEDLGSSVGTVVNGDPLQDATAIQPTDVIQLGETVVRVLSKSSSKRRVRTSKAVADEQGEPSKSKQDTCRLEFEVMSNGKRNALEVPRGEAFIGRENEGHPIDVDLSEDLAASRVHARVWVENEGCWVEDLNSTHGVKVNGQLIEGKVKLGKTDAIQIGSAQLRVQAQVAPIKRKPAPRVRGVAETGPLPSGLEEPSDRRYPVWKSGEFCCLPPEVRQAEDVKFVQPEAAPVGIIRMVNGLAIDAKPEINALNQRKSFDYYRHLLEFPRGLGLSTELDGLCLFIVEHMIKVFPEAARASLFLCDPTHRVLVLRAHVPNLKPVLSPLLAQQAIAQGMGYVWEQCDKEESMQRLPIHGGLYAPMKNGAIETGLICVDTMNEKSEYQPEDLSLLIAMAQVAAPYVQLLSENQ